MADRKLQNRGWIGTLQRGDEGQALVETSIALTMLLLMLMGAAEFAQVIYASIQVSNAAKAGAAYGAENSNTMKDAPGIQTAAAADAGPFMSNNLTAIPSYIGICASGTACTGTGSTCQNTDCPAPDQIEYLLTVNTSATVTPAFHWTGLPTTFTITGQAIQLVPPN